MWDKTTKYINLCISEDIEKILVLIILLKFAALLIIFVVVNNKMMPTNMN